MHGAGGVGELRVLDEAMGDVDAETVDTSIEPETEDLVVFGSYFLVVPVHVGLGRVEDVEVPLTRVALGVRDSTPALAAEDGAPVVGW